MKGEICLGVELFWCQLGHKQRRNSVKTSLYHGECSDFWIYSRLKGKKKAKKHLDESSISACESLGGLFSG